MQILVAKLWHHTNARNRKYKIAYVVLRNPWKSSEFTKRVGVAAWRLVQASCGMTTRGKMALSMMMEESMLAMVTRGNVEG